MKISVIIATCNHGQWIAESIESALNQTLKPHEIIVVDLASGSKDDTREVVARYPVKYVNQPGKGVSDARNYGVKISTGDWAAFLDADDYWLPNRLEAQAAVITDQAFGYCARTLFYPNGATEPGEYHAMPEALSALRWGNFIDTSAGMVRRDAFDRVGGFNQESCAGEEWELWLKLAQHYKFVGIPDRLLMYRVTGTGLSANPVTVLKSMEYIVAAATDHLPFLDRFVISHRMRAVRTTLAGLKYRDLGEYQNTLRYALQGLRHWPFYGRAFKVILLEIRRRLGQTPQHHEA